MIHQVRKPTATFGIRCLIESHQVRDNLQISHVTHMTLLIMCGVPSLSPGLTKAVSPSPHTPPNFVWKRSLARRRRLGSRPSSLCYTVFRNIFNRTTRGVCFLRPETYISQQQHIL